MSVHTRVYWISQSGRAAVNWHWSVPSMAYPALELFRDVVLLTLVLVNWICTSAIADAVTEDVAARRACAVYIAVFACVVNVYSFQRSWTKLGKPDAPRESILGLFAQVCNLTQVWGALFAAARYFFLPEDNLFFTTSLMHAQAEWNSTPLRRHPPRRPFGSHSCSN